jgi:hypothetical protein
VKSHQRRDLFGILHNLVRLDVRPEQPPQLVPMDDLPAPQRVWRSLVYTVDDFCYRLSPGGELRGIAMWTLRVVVLCLIPLAGLGLILSSVQAMLSSFTGVIVLIGCAALLMVAVLVTVSVRR